jgi:pimeloyl-ACP methyl ester carboxylesterase
VIKRFNQRAAVSTVTVLCCLMSVHIVAKELWQTVPFPTTFPPPISSSSAEVNGINLFFAQWGDGDRTVILLHGGLTSIEAWSNQVLFLARTHRVIAIDSRGHGRSTRGKQPYSYALMASDVIALMDELSIPRAAFVGWSDGGIIALELAMKHPNRVDKALTVGTNYSPAGVDHSLDRNSVFGEFAQKAAKQYEEISPTPDEFTQFLGAITRMWNTQPNYTEEELQDVIAQFTVVQAIEDEAIIDEHAEKMASLLPNATYVPLDGLSHFALWQDPARLNTIIGSFLQKK